MRELRPNGLNGFSPLTRDQPGTDECRDDHQPDGPPDTNSLAERDEDGDLDDWDHHKRSKENPTPTHGAEDTGAGRLRTWTLVTCTRR